MICHIIHRETFFSFGTFSTYTYGYDELGRRKSVVNGGTQFSPAELNKWGYNPKSELVWSYRHEGSNPDEPGTEITAERRLYTYDQIGNRLDTTVGNYSTPTLRYCADDLNRYNQTYTTRPTPATSRPARWPPRPSRSPTTMTGI